MCCGNDCLGRADMTPTGIVGAATTIRISGRLALTTPIVAGWLDGQIDQERP